MDSQKDDRKAELAALVEAAGATRAAIEVNFMAGRLAGADLLRAIDLLATLQTDLRALEEDVATFMADRAATLQLTLEVAAGAPLSSSSVAVLATVKATIKRLGIKTRQGADVSLSEEIPAPTTATDAPMLPMRRPGPSIVDGREKTMDEKKRMSAEELTKMYGEPEIVCQLTSDVQEKLEQSPDWKPLPNPEEQD